MDRAGDLSGQAFCCRDPASGEKPQGTIRVMKSALQVPWHIGRTVLSIRQNMKRLRS